MSGFKQALPFVLRMEGGYVDDPDDRGGATNFGITQATYDAWRESVDQDRRPVRQITRGEVEMIYHARYWRAAKCDALPWPLSAAHFDAAVNHGVERAGKLLQEALGVTVDGIIGPQTLGAVESSDVARVLRDLLWIRLDFYYRISTGTQIKFLRGWLRRMIHLRESIAREAAA